MIGKIDGMGGTGEVVHVLNGQYYRTSGAQRRRNIETMNEGITWMSTPVTISDWRVRPEDGHLNVEATDQVMRDLALRLLSFVD